MSESNYTVHPNYPLIQISIEEVWKDVKDYEGFYRVSNWGRVKSLARIVPMSDGRKYRVSEKILKPAWTGHYNHVIFSRDGKEILHGLHVLVLEAFVGPRPEGMEGCHNDRNPKNNRLENLRWDTPKGNHSDRMEHGTLIRGRKGNSWKLRGKYEEIYSLYETGEYTQQNLADKYNVTSATIARVVSIGRERQQMAENG